jgi:hypothetical protein
MGKNRCIKAVLKKRCIKAVLKKRCIKAVLKRRWIKAMAERTRSRSQSPTKRCIKAVLKKSWIKAMAKRTRSRSQSPQKPWPYSHFPDFDDQPVTPYSHLGPHRPEEDWDYERERDEPQHQPAAIAPPSSPPSETRKLFIAAPQSSARRFLTPGERDHAPHMPFQLAYPGEYSPRGPRSPDARWTGSPLPAPSSSEDICFM